MSKLFPRYFEHTLLKSDATEATIEQLCKEAIEYDCHAVVVNPCFVRFASDILVDASQTIASVVGFPLGANKTSTKIAEAVAAVQDGATEVDVVANISMLADNQIAVAGHEVTAIMKELPDDIICKVIVEASLHDNSRLTEITKMVADSGAQFIKTSTGFSGGATVSQIELIRSVVGEKLKIKASGGIKTLQSARELISAGADRIGSSQTIAILQEWLQEQN